jgi:hypothetical protein
MADIKISALPQASALDGSEMIPATQSGTNPVKLTVNQISSKVRGDILPIGTDDISDNTINLNKFTESARQYIGAGGSIVNNPDDVTLESFVEGGVNKLRVKTEAIEQILSCGIQFNFDSPATALTRIGNDNIKNEIFSTCIRPVTLNDAGVVTQELATNINYKTNGQASDLTGASGQCMVGIKKLYIKRTTDAQNRLTKLQFSLVPLPGFTLHEKFTWGSGRDEIFVGMFEASSDGSKMQSIVGGSIYASVTLATARAQAVARGTGWHTYDFYTQDLIQSLWYLYFAELNSQVSLPGFTELSSYADSYMRTTGRSNILTTINGSIHADATLDSDIYNLGWNDTNKYIANRFMYIENIFGHVWKMIDGCSPDGRVAGAKHMFATPNPSLFSSDQSTILSTYTDLGIALASSSNDGYIGSIGLFFNPITLGGSSSTYVTDYNGSYLADTSRDYIRLLLAGGILNYSAQAGVAARHSANFLAFATSNVGFRLCFEKN